MPHSNDIPADVSASPEAGFALPEMLVTIALISLLSVLVFAVVGQVVRFWNVAWLETRRSRETIAAVTQLRTLLSSPIPIALRDADGRPRLQFLGRSDRIEFIGAAREQPMGGVVRYSLRAEGPSGAQQLILCRDADFVADLRQDACATRTVIVTHGGDVEFAYAGAGSGELSTRWRSEWSPSDGFPGIVRIQSRAVSAGQTALGLVIPVMTAIGAPCIVFPQGAPC